MKRALAWVLAVGLVAALTACGGTHEVVCEGRIEGNRCIIDPVPDTSSGEDVTTPPPDTSPPEDTSTGTPDVAPPKDVVVEADVPDDPEYVCEPALEAIKPIGAACGRHCECETGYCYDEAYLGDFRFCTRDCDGACGKTADGLHIQCLNLGGTPAKKYNLTHTWICQPTCITLDDCAALSGLYTACGVGTQTTWHVEGEKSPSTLATQKTCTILSEVQ